MLTTKKFGCELEGNMKARIAYLDAVKLVTIYLVIMGHVTQMMVHGWTIGVHLWKPIYSFHMPLFMLVSGFFVSNRMLNLPFGKMIKAKAIQLLLPAATCTVVCCVYLYFARESVNYRDEIIGNSWFLKTLFVYFVLFWMLKRTRLNDWLIFALSCAFLFLVPKGSSLQVNLLWPYFWAGFFLKKYHILDKMIVRWQLVLVFFLLYTSTYAIQWFSDIPNIITINPETLYNQWYLILFRYIVAFSGSMFVILLVAWVYERWHDLSTLKKLATFGQYTLGVYTLQTILVNNVFPDSFAWCVENKWLLDLVVAPILSLGFLFVCLWLIHQLSKIKMLDLLFFGGQYYKR